MGCSKSHAKGKIMALNVYIKKQGSQINSLTSQLKELEREQNKPNLGEEGK